jgi:hypothetical protein
VPGADSVAACPHRKPELIWAKQGSAQDQPFFLGDHRADAGGNEPGFGRQPTGAMGRFLASRLAVLCRGGRYRFGRDRPNQMQVHLNRLARTPFYP